MEPKSNVKHLLLYTEYQAKKQQAKILNKNKNNKKDKQMIYLILIDSILSLKQKKIHF